MITFTIEVIGNTEIRYGSLTSQRKLELRDQLQTYIAHAIKSSLEIQEQDAEMTDDVSITVG